MAKYSLITYEESSETSDNDDESIEFAGKLFFMFGKNR